MTYGIELSFNNKQEVIELPVMPESMEMSEAGKSQTYDVFGLGEVNVIKDRQLSEYSFSSIFPGHRYPFVPNGAALKQPTDYVKTIMTWMETKKPIRFIFVGDVFEINTPASIESFDWKEVAGSRDIQYTLKLKHYRFFAAIPVVMTETEAGVVLTTEEPPRSTDWQPPGTYTMVSGDTLWGVAQSQLGDGSRWGEIQQLNGITDAEIKRLPIGKVLNLPV